ncbi:hypothetical protein TW85_06420 [Marinomonas sp. S3726]|uniref:hypothetical protein n=1 Tax=Marinomonas sp. S3726 TaxID=579484 RepID=UPI0005F9FD17|nr:hypothetical protein [Marinomonas sp. S3726]KJZ15214.1 hypothetical protein TW85_06420 [Marinomonas sp. S3726]
MKHSKVTQKLNQKVIAAVDVVEAQLFAAVGADSIEDKTKGFLGIVYDVNFSNFPASLDVRCYFEDDTALASMKEQESLFQKKLHQQLFKRAIILKDARNNLHFYVQEPDAMHDLEGQ